MTQAVTKSAGAVVLTRPTVAALRRQQFRADLGTRPPRKRGG